MSAVAQSSPKPLLKKEKIRYYPNPSYFVGRMTYEEYLEFEPESGPRFEFLEGKVYEMPGGTPPHNLIISNTLRALGNFLEANHLDCDAYTGDQKVYIKGGYGLYPDVTVVCGEAEFDTGNALLNPNVIVEVLSPSTSGYDQGLKFEKYRTIPSLRHYILIAQRRVSVTHFEKIAGNLWAIVGEHYDLADTLTVTLGDAKITAPLTAIYRRVELPLQGDDAEMMESEEEAE